MLKLKLYFQVWKLLELTGSELGGVTRVMEDDFDKYDNNERPIGELGAVNISVKRNAKQQKNTIEYMNSEYLHTK